MGRRLSRLDGSVRVSCPRCRGVVRIHVRLKEGRGAPAKPRLMECPRVDCGGVVRVEVAMGRGRSA